MLTCTYLNMIFLYVSPQDVKIAILIFYEHFWFVCFVLFFLLNIGGRPRVEVAL